MNNDLKNSTGVLHAQEIELARTVIEFCRFARANGLTSTTQESLDCLRVLRTLRQIDLDIFKFSLRAALCSSKEDWELFDSLFDTFWGTRMRKTESQARRPCSKLFANGQHGNENPLQTLIQRGAVFQSDSVQTEKAVSGASSIERIQRLDFSQISQADLTGLDRIALRLLRRMSLRVSRKLRPTYTRGVIDLRRTIRSSIERGGEFIERRYKRRKLERARLVILLDVSHSMNPYSLFLFKFAYSLNRHCGKVASFIFSTSLMDVSEALRALRLSDALNVLSQAATGWSGGTRIGSSLHDFNRLHASKLLRSKTVVVILSDGWDTGEPEDLVAELKVIKRRARKIIWLSPLLGLDEYAPTTRAMNAALPYLDVFAPAHNLESLLALEKHLTPSVPG
jgi:hypothetical protein